MYKKRYIPQDSKRAPKRQCQGVVPTQHEIKYLYIIYTLDIYIFYVYDIYSYVCIQ